MKTNRSNTEFWTLLTMVNLLVLIYPIHLLLNANSVDDNLFATLILVLSILLIVVVDSLSILVADGAGSGKTLRLLESRSADNYLRVAAVCNKRRDLADVRTRER